MHVRERSCAASYFALFHRPPPRRTQSVACVCVSHLCRHR